MNPMAPADAGPWFRVWSLAILVYAMFWAGFYLYVAIVFGPPYANISAIALAIPLMIAVRIRSRWPTVKRSELALLLVLLLVVVVGFSLSVSYWYDKRLNDTYATDVRFAELGSEVAKDKLFRNVRLVMGSCIKKTFRYSAEGTVSSQADIERLGCLARSFHVPLSVGDLTVLDDQERRQVVH